MESNTEHRGTQEGGSLAAHSVLTQHTPSLSEEDLAEGFWLSAEGEAVRGGVRLNRMLPLYLGRWLRFSSDDEIEMFYGESPRSAGPDYYALRRMVLYLWPQRRPAGWDKRP